MKRRRNEQTIAGMQRIILSLAEAEAEAETVSMLLQNEYTYNIEQAKTKLYLANGREFDMPAVTVKQKEPNNVHNEAR